LLWVVAILFEESVIICGTVSAALHNLSSTTSLVRRIMSWSFCTRSFCAWVRSTCQWNVNHTLVLIVHYIPPFWTLKNSVFYVPFIVEIVCFCGAGN
jgi:hypothetical protein